MFLIPSMCCFFSLSCPGAVYRGPRMAKSTSSQVIGNSKSYKVSLLCDTGLFVFNWVFWENLSPIFDQAFDLSCLWFFPVILTQHWTIPCWWTFFEQILNNISLPLSFNRSPLFFYLVWFWFSRKYDVLCPVGSSFCVLFYPRSRWVVLNQATGGVRFSVHVLHSLSIKVCVFECFYLLICSAVMTALQQEAECTDIDPE